MRWFIPVSTFLLAIMVLFSHFWFSEQTSLPLLIGYKDSAVFDLWSVQHFLMGVVTGRIILQKFKEPLVFVSAMLFVALAWEGLEILMEAGEMGITISVWKGGFEHWGNRLIGDPLVVTLGGLISRKNHRFWKYALIYCISWLALNVVMPDSMYIQRILLGG